MFVFETDVRAELLADNALPMGMEVLVEVALNGCGDLGQFAASLLKPLCGEFDGFQFEVYRDCNGKLSKISGRKELLTFRNLAVLYPKSLLGHAYN